MEDNIATILKIAEDVYQTLGSGHTESVYDNAMQVGLRLKQIKYESQRVVELRYLDHYVGEGYPDLIVHFEPDALVVELKAVAGFGPAEVQQLTNYLRVLDLKYGLLINFQAPCKPTKKDEKIPKVEYQVVKRQAALRE
jgi:GxxExxY protein